MFSVKATYRGEIRRFSFPHSTSFPTYDQLYIQLHRVFPSSNNYYLSKLLFCPDSSKPGRILIAREVHTAEDYNKCLVAFQGRSWPNALLRFSLLDENSSGFVSGNLNQPVGQVPWRTDGPAAPLHSSATTRPLSSFYIPPPPVTFSVPPRALSQAPMDIDPVYVDVSNQNPRTLFSGLHSVPPPPRPNSSGCCNIAETKVEIQNLLHTFQQDLDRILLRTFEHTTSDQNVQHTSTHATPPPAVPVNNAFLPFHSSPLDCSLCRTPVVGERFICSACSALVCSECNIYGRADFCAVSLGRHTLRLVPFPGASLSNGTLPSWPHSWSSWSPRPLPSLPIVAPPWVSSSSTYNNLAFPTRYMSSSPPIEPFIPPLRTLSPEANATPVPQCSSMYPSSPRVPQASCPPASPLLPPTPPPLPVIHRGIICDACDSTIVGVRHKCLDCPDYDLCTPCISSGSSERHNPRHQFFELAEPTRIIVHTVNQDDERAPLDPASFAPAAPLSDLPVLHHATCDLCDSIIQGNRYKCTICPDFDTCNSCFMITKEQHPNHSFVKLSRTEDYISRGHPLRRHHFARCDACNKSIEGVRYKCMHADCPDFDLCEKCEALPIPQHPENHPMLKMKSVETVIPTVYRVGRPFTHHVPEQARTPDFEDGYMHNPSLSWGTVASETPSPVAHERTHARSPSPGIAGLRTSYESAKRVSSSATSESTPANLDHLAELSAQHRSVSPTSVRSNSPALPPTSDERSSFSSQWMASVNYPLYPLHNNGLSQPASNNWTEVTNRSFPTNAQPVSRRTSSHVHQEEPLTLRFDPVVETSSASPSSPLNYRVPDVHGTPPPAPLLNTGSWFGEGLNSLLQTVPEQVSPAFSSSKAQTSQPQPGSPSKHTTADSPLNNEALLSRSPVTEMQQITPPNSRSLTELLNGYRSMSSIYLEDHEALNRSLTPDVVDEPLSARFLEDVTAPDGQIFAAGVTFIKIWRMVNNGTCNWPASTKVVFVGGAQLASGNPPPHIQPMHTIGPLKPGEEKNIWTCELKAPDAPGKYTSYWRLRDDQGQLFGDSIWVEIEVVNPSYSHIDESLTSSSIIVMPDPTSPRTSPSIVSRSPTIRTEETSDDGVSDSDSVSLISLPSSEDEDDAALWADSRERAPVNRADDHTQAMEYVLLYDDNTSEGEE